MPVGCGVLGAAVGEQPRTASAAGAERTPGRWRPSALLVRPRGPGRTTDADWKVVLAEEASASGPRWEFLLAVAREQLQERERERERERDSGLELGRTAGDSP